MKTLILRFVSGDGGVDMHVALDLEEMRCECSASWCADEWSEMRWELTDLARDMATYPISPDRPVQRGAGSFFGLQIMPVGSTGELLAEIAVNDQMRRGNRFQGEFNCHYGDLARFREELDAALTSCEGEARLLSTSSR